MASSSEEALAPLRAEVIDAARAVIKRTRELYGNPVDHTAHPSEQLLCKAVAALDEAERPDPWAMLARFRDDLPSSYWNTGEPDAPGHMLDRLLQERGLR